MSHCLWNPVQQSPFHGRAALPEQPRSDHRTVEKSRAVKPAGRDCTNPQSYTVISSRARSPLDPAEAQENLNISWEEKEKNFIVLMTDKSQDRNSNV